MTEPNKYGLPRTLPADVARQVRQECGFGCVICGESIVTYDHFAPEYKEAWEHLAAGIALLCGGCHDKKSRHFWSAQKVVAARANPRCHQIGFARSEMDFGSPHYPVVYVGSNVFVNCRPTLVIDDEIALEFLEPEEPGGPYRLHAIFRDEAGEPIFEVNDNVWQVNSGSWDVQCVGGEIDIRRHQHRDRLTLQCRPPYSVSITRLDITMRNGQRLVCKDGGVGKMTPDGKYHHTMTNAQMISSGGMSFG